MRLRVRLVLSLLALSASLALARKDKKPILPASVLSAQTVLVLIDPDAGRPLNAPLERSPLWRYARKDALRSPGVPAVEEFRKAAEEAEKPQTQQKQKGKP